MADVAPNLACDPQVWRRSPNGIRTRVSTLRGWPGPISRPAAMVENGR